VVVQCAREVRVWSKQLRSLSCTDQMHQKD
jgi:hypothetical protein